MPSQLEAIELAEHDVRQLGKERKRVQLAAQGLTSQSAVQKLLPGACAARGGGSESLSASRPKAPSSHEAEAPLAVEALGCIRPTGAAPHVLR